MKKYLLTALISLIIVLFFTLYSNLFHSEKSLQNTIKMFESISAKLVGRVKKVSKEKKKLQRKNNSGSKERMSFSRWKKNREMRSTD